MPSVSNRQKLLCLLSLSVGIVPLCSFLWKFCRPTSTKFESVFNSAASSSAASSLHENGSTTKLSLTSHRQQKEEVENVAGVDHVTRTAVTSSTFTFLLLQDDSQSPGLPVVVLQEVAYQHQIRMIRAAVVTLVTVFIPMLAYCYVVAMQWMMRRPPKGWCGDSINDSNKLSTRKTQIRIRLREYRVTYSHGLPTNNKSSSSWSWSWWFGRLQQIWRKCHPGSNNNNNNNTQNIIDIAKETMDDECPICLEEFLYGQTIIVSRHCSCTHSSFHEQCIFSWLAQKHRNGLQQCPCCRSTFFPSKTK